MISLASKRAQTTLLIVLAVVAWQWSQQKSGGEPQAESRDDSVQTYLKGSEMVRFNALGQASDSIGALEITYYSRQPRGELVSPSLSKTIGATESWSAQADFGYIDETAQTITLDGSVILSHDSNTLRLTTEQLTLDLDQDIAHTDRAVALVHRNTRTTALGVRARLNEQSFTLLSNVDSTYAPQN